MAGETRSSELGRTGGLRLSVVVPVYNEEKVISLTHDALIDVLGNKSDVDLEVIYVDDGSSDGTGLILRTIAENDERVKVIEFSRNFGHQAAVTAGIAHASGDVVAVMDADLQDPPAVFLEMIEKWREGFDVVFGIRSKRKETPGLKMAYAVFYRVFGYLSDIHMPLDAGDFALMDRRVVDVLNDLPEKNRFIRGLRAWTGFRQTGVRYDRAARRAGETKYPLTKLLKLSFDGIFNFSTLPLTLIFIAGCLTALMSMFVFVVLFLQWAVDFKIFGFGYQDVPGVTTVILALLFFSGLQLVSIGILGEYIGRMYQEVKNRPSFIVRDIYRSGKHQSGGGEHPTETDDG